MRTLCFLIAALGLVFTRQSSAIVFEQVDTFQDGTTMGWAKGPASQDPPSNVASGGPAGAGDRFLQNISNGGAGADSRMVVFNQAQWKGDYNAAGIHHITAHLANLGSTTLHMRIALRGGTGGNTSFASSAPAVLPPDGVWRLVTFDLTPGALASINGSDTLAVVLSSVVELRILSAANGPAFIGDTIAATLGTDNVAARGLRITEIVLEDVPRISFTTIPVRSYRVERKNALMDSEWVPLSGATNVPGTGSEVQVSDTEPEAGNLPMRFYRAVLLPP